METTLKDKSKETPKKLYKYYSFSKYWDTALNGKVYLSHPSEFNDPFECKPHYDFAHLEIWLANNTPTFLLLGTPPRQMLKKTLKNFWWLYKRKYLEHFEKYRLSCFTTKHENLLMWAHYAASHTGFCLEFVTNQKALLGTGKTELYKVCYQPERPIVRPSLFLGKLSVLSVIEAEELSQKIFHSKSKEWEYEDEWRIVSQEPTAKNNEGLICNLSDFGLTLSAVYFGCKITAENKKKLFNKVAELNQLREQETKIQLHDAVIHEKEYKLTFTPS